MKYLSVKYRRLPINSNLLGKSKKVRVMESSNQITGNKEIRKWVGKECKCHVHCTLHVKGSKRIIFNVSDFSTLFVVVVVVDLSHA